LSARPAFEKAAGAETKAVLENIIIDGVRSGSFPLPGANERQLAAATLAVWPALHGLTMLAIDDFVGPAADAESLVKPILGALFDGFASHPPTLPPHIWVAPWS
jgi:hypothetical protein